MHVQLDEVYDFGVCVLEVEQFVSADVPVGGWFVQRLFEDHLAVDSPDLEQKHAPSVLIFNEFVFDFDQNWAKVLILLILAACDNFVELVEWDLVLDHFHEVLG